MRLRYLHLPRSGPLEDVTLVFGQETLLYGPKAIVEPKREGAINFVVGINGTGKSTVLRALYRTFRALKNRRLPPLPVTVIWEAGDPGVESTRTCFFDQSSGIKDAFFGLMAPSDYPDDWQAGDWISELKRLRESRTELQAWGIERDIPGVPALQAFLPRRLIAYTSGEDVLWDELEMEEFRDLEEFAGVGYDAGDRPSAWSLEKEWENEQPTRIGNALTRMGVKAGAEMTDLGPGNGSAGTMKPEVAAAWQETIQPLAQLSRRVFENQVLQSQQPPEATMRVRQEDLRLAAVALALLETAAFVRRCPTEDDEKAERSRRIKGGTEPDRIPPAQRVLDRLDWFRTTHLSFTYRDAEDRVSKQQTEQLMALLALAEPTQVLEQPLDRQRVVIRLLRDERIDLDKRLNTAAPSITSMSPGLEAIQERTQSCVSGAEAILRIFTENQGDSALGEIFRALRAWKGSGLLEDITLTIQRLHPVLSADNEPAESYVTFNQLSDGEQMLLGRMALLFLLQGQHQSLLLLDEPETHFNDVWKREIIDYVDDALLKKTKAQVVVATHTSIALTDVFSTEITRLVKRGDGRTVATGISMPTFGADPGRIMQNVFASPDSIGSRAQELLENWLKLPPEDQATLEHLVRELGGGYHRAKLRGLLERKREEPWIRQLNELVRDQEKADEEQMMELQRLREALIKKRKEQDTSKQTQDEEEAGPEEIDHTSQQKGGEADAAYD